MKVIVFDTETTGLPRYEYRNNHRVRIMPYMVQIAWILFDVEKNTLVASHNHIVKLPDGVKIPAESIKFHRITQEIMDTHGERINDVLIQFVDHVKLADYVVAHNIKFDKEIVEKEFSRNGMINHFDVMEAKKVFYCTMKESEELCNIMVPDIVNGGKRRKYPRLEELHKVLFSKDELKDLHNAYNDILVCFRCFYKMMFDRDIARMNNKIRSLFRSLFDIRVTPYGK